MLDLDHFKQVNDALGHKAGDDLLVNVASRLSRVLQGKGMLARWGAAVRAEHAFEDD